MPAHIPRAAMRVCLGDRVRLELPYSEVCMHMRVAGRVMTVEVIGGEFPDGRQWYAAQLHHDDGRPFSAPILTGEAGIHGYGDEMHCYPADASREARP
jgi:hypothetical protein